MTETGLPPVQTLPDCMMPDGADPCKAYSELRAAYDKAISEGRELREQVARSEAENGHYHDRAIKAEARERAAREALPLLHNVWCMGAQERDSEWEYQWRQLMQAVELALTAAGYKTAGHGRNAALRAGERT